jgi:predicted ester cyclase
MLKMLEAFNAGDTDVVEKLIHPDVVDKAAHKGLDPAIRTLPTIEHVKAQIKMDRTAVPDGKFEPVTLIAEGDQVVLQWRLTGTHTGPLLGIKATNRKVDIQGTEFVRIRDGQIIEHDDAGYHALEALRQLGLLKHPELAEEIFD